MVLKVINLKELTLKQKIAQMVIVRGDSRQPKFSELGVGGIFLGKQKSAKECEKTVAFYKSSLEIKPFFCTDLEGAWNTFKKIKKFKGFSEIKTKEGAFELGTDQGKLLKEFGVDLNFSPVAEMKDTTYSGRAFLGNKKEISEKLEYYLKGLQKYAKGTCKHFPGKCLLRNQHVFVDKEKIGKEDLELFNVCFKNKISAVMVSHAITSGAIDSQGLPSTISPKTISLLRKKFKGLVITDDINMLALRVFSLSKKKTYKRVINAGNDLIIDVGFGLGKYSGIHRLSKILDYLVKETKEGRISEDKIDENVKRILEFKGYKVVS